MSVVAVKKTRKYIEIAADNQVSSWRNKMQGSDRGNHDAKLFKSGELIFGTAGYTDIASLFRIYVQSRKPDANTEVGLLNFLSEFIDWCKKKDGDFKLVNNFIIIFKKKIYVTHGLEVSEVDDYTAIGSGMFLALGAMYMGANVEKAIDVAKKYDLYCGGETISMQIEI